MTWFLFSVLVVSWILGAAVTFKLEAALVGEPTWKNNVSFLWPLLLWWLAAIYLLTCKHHVNNGGKNEWDY